MLLPDTRLYHLTSDVMHLTPDRYYLSPAPCYDITYQLPPVMLIPDL